MLERQVHLVLGGPGTGKTTYFVGNDHLPGVIGELLEAGTKPHEIAYVSFTRKAADEAAERAAQRFGFERSHLPYFRTIHSLAFQLTGMQQRDTMQRADYREIAKLLGVQFTGYTDPADGPALPSREGDLILQWMGYARARCLSLKEVWRRSGEAVEWPLVELFAKTVEQYKRDTRKHDFADMLDAFTAGGAVVPVKVAIIDEAQDLSTAQWRAVRSAFREVPVIYIAGDDDQCQPTGTQVMTTDGPKDIATIDHSVDRLLVYSRGDAEVYGKRNGGYRFSKAVRLYSGHLYTLHAAGNSTQCTADHHHLVKWAPHMKDRKWNAVYLMRSGTRYRIGWCQLFNGGTFHVAQRANKEDADAVWLLGVYDTKAEASLWESIYAARYGIPTAPFQPVHGARYFTQEWIDTLFDSVDSEQAGLACLADAGLSYKQPFIDRRKQNYSRFGAVIMRHHVRNLQHGDFLTAVYADGKRPKWVPLTIERDSVEDIPVYSLHVEKYHTYIADGIITHNCIHTWAGADVEQLLRLRANRTVLPVSHRLPREVFSFATGIAKRIKHRYAKEWQPAEHSGHVHHLASHDAIDLASGSSWMLLARNSCFLDEYRDLCYQQGVPFTEASGPAVDPAHIRAIVTWERLRKGATVPAQDVADLSALIGGWRYRGGVEGVQTLQQLQDEWRLPTTTIWHEAFTRLAADRREYYAHCLRNGYRLQDKAPVHIGTIHSVKGGEADNVVLRTDMTYRTSQGLEQDPDNEHRVFYVGASRARRELLIVDPQEENGYTTG